MTSDEPRPDADETRAELITRRPCDRCGSLQALDNAFCSSCGNPISATAPSTASSAEGEHGPKASRRRRKVLVASTVVIAIATIGAGVGIWFRYQPSTRDVTTQAPETTTTTTEATTTTAEPPEPREPSELELINAAKDAVWRVEATGCGYEIGGTAWALDDNHLITNGHVVTSDSAPTLHSPDGDVIEATVIGRDLAPDLAVLRSDEPLSHQLEWAETSELDEGEPLIGLGFPAPAGDFATNPGTLVSFHTENGRREALRTDAALDHGSSGGPMITSSGEVAGVVTRMEINEGGFQNVPLAFTAEALDTHIETMIAEPTAPRADCALTEALNEIPDDPWDIDPWDIDPWEGEQWDPPEVDVPEPEFVVPEHDLPEPTTPTTVPCPTGEPSVEITSVDSELYYEGLDGLNSYDVTVTGRVTNDSSAMIDLWSVDVRVDGDTYDSYGSVDSMTLRPGESTSFRATASVYDIRQPPTGASVEHLDWDWEDFDHYGCGT